jgi:hypothetical protein
MDKIEICHNCNLYKYTCEGERFENTEKKPNECLHSKRTPNNTKSDIQVAAFGSLFRTKVKGGTDSLTAFVESIVHTSDEAFADAILKRGHLLKKHRDIPRTARGRKAVK